MKLPAMKKHEKISLALTTASYTLMGITPQAQAQTGLKNWETSSAILLYNESDRVSVAEGVVSAKHNIDTDESATFKFTFDSLSGASANGAVPSTQPQTFTAPSGSSGYTAPANTVPLDDTFMDTRFAFSASWDRPIDHVSRYTIGGNFSTEIDYTSFGVNTLYAHDVNQKNTTLSAGLSLSMDTVSPTGGAAQAFEPMQISVSQTGENEGEGGGGGSSENKTLVDALFGITQILDKNSLIQFNYSYGQAQGYLTDPYKVVSVVDPDTGEVIIQDAATSLPLVLFENRPDSRTKQSFFTQYKRYISGDVVDFSYRYMFDDWGINSNTYEMRYRWKLSSTSYLQPHVRYYDQTAADFFTPYFVSGSQPASGDSSSYASADYRLGELKTSTLGVEYGRKYHSHGWSLSGEYYLQSVTEPADKIGVLNDFQLYPDVEAYMVRFNYDF